MAEREERICIPFTHTYDQFTTFFYDGRVYLSDTSYPIGQCCVDIANMDEEVLREIDRRVEKFVPAAWALLSKKTNSAVSSAQKKMNAVWDIIFTMPVYRDLNMATELSYHTLERLYAQKAGAKGALGGARDVRAHDRRHEALRESGADTSFAAQDHDGEIL